MAICLLQWPFDTAITLYNEPNREHQTWEPKETKVISLHSNKNNMPPPFEGIRVLDLSTMLPWGYATLILSELGAEVIKVERPGQGDYTRAIPPAKNGLSYLHLAINRGKRSIALNLKNEMGRMAFYRLCRTADVVVENFKPGVAERLGIDYATLSKINYRIIYCSITAFGHNSIYSKIGAHDINVLSLTGALHMLSDERGEPLLPGMLIADFATSLFAVVGITTALYERERTGRGKRLEITMFESVFPFMLPWLAEYFFEGRVLGPGEHLLRGGSASYNVYRTRDGGKVTVGIPMEKNLWKSFCELLGRTDITEKMFSREALEELQKFFLSKTLEEVLKELLFKADCFTPVYDLGQAVQSELSKERGVFAEFEVEGIGKVPLLTIPKGLGALGKSGWPELGEDTEPILRELGYSREEIELMKRSGALG